MSKLDQLLEELQKAKVKLEKPEGISDVGIEARRADTKVPGVVAHGYGRTMSPEKHGERAKAYVKQDIANLKAQPKPNLTKEEYLDMIDKADKVVHPKDPVLNYDKVQPKAKTPAKQKEYETKVSAVCKEEEMEKDSVNPALAPKERKIKDLQAQIDAGTYKPDSKKIAGAMLKFDEQAVDKAPMPSTIHKEIPIKDKEKKQLVDSEGNTIERLEFNKDGQWVLVKKHIGFDNLQHKLEEEGHSKESAGNIAYAIGAKKYGKQGMENKAHKSEEDAE